MHLKEMLSAIIGAGFITLATILTGNIIFGYGAAVIVIIIIAFRAIKQ